MDEHARGDRFHLAEPFHTASLVARQCLVLASGPSLELAIDVLKQPEHRRPIERPIVVPPPLYRRIVLLRDIIKCYRCPTMDPPTPHRLPHPFERIATHPRQETGKAPMVFAERHPGSERKS